MKQKKGIRKNKSQNEPHKAKRLEPIVKSGKERYQLYRGLNNIDEIDDQLAAIPKQKSILDYYDDGEDE